MLEDVQQPAKNKEHKELNKKAELSQRWQRDAPYIMGALKIFESPWVRPRLLVPKFLMGFCSDRRSMNMPTKFEVRSFTHCWEK